ncbi:MAG: IPT/TIG domain-containing protein, partial [Chloroflexota bacterium]
RIPAAFLAVAVALMMATALSAVAAPPSGAAGQSTTAAPMATATPPLLPGETAINGIPSFDFGANDAVNWDPQFNMDVAPDGPVIQAALKAAHIQIARTWFFQNSLVDGHALSDAEQVQKLQAVQAAGMRCFANFPTENSVAYDLHLLAILDTPGHIACPYVEVMNEPDIEGVNSTAYLAFWNSFVPQARAAYPGVAFGGPADYDNQGNECTYYPDGTSACFLQKVMLGMVKSGVLPDFVTFHWYPCWNNTAAQCLALASGFASASQQVIDWDTQIFGHLIPVICSEWNGDPGSPDFMFDRNWDSQFVSAAEASIATSGLSGAMEFDISSYGNYSADDLFDIYSGGAPFATFTGYAGEIAALMGGTPPPPPPPPPPPVAPTIASFTPASGPVGTSVNVSGSGLTGATSVTLNGQTAAFVVASDTSLSLTVPSGASTGAIGVTTPSGMATSATDFTVTVTPPPPPPAPPAISGFSPTSGPVGTVLTLTGTGFTGATSVRFNGTAATAYTVASATRITATVPAGATSGPISVTTPNGSATSAASFTVTITPPPPPPPPGGSLALVQASSQFVDYAGVNESYATYAAPVVRGDLLIAEVAIVGGNDVTINKVEDDLGNVWHLAAVGVNGDNSRVAIYYANGTVSGADEVDAYLTFQPDSTSLFAQTIMTVSEFSGAGTLVSGHAHASTGTAHSSGNGAATAAGDLVVGAYADAGYDTSVKTSDSKAQLGTCQQSTEAAQGDQSYGYASGAGSVSVAYHTGGYAYGEVAVAVFAGVS